MDVRTSKSSRLISIVDYVQRLGFVYVLVDFRDWADLSAIGRLGELDQ
jgi:hypothetical protein